MNQFHPQPYYPQWIEEEQLVFTGTCLPQNGINQGTDKNFVLPSFTYGYADNYPNDAAEAWIEEEQLVFTGTCLPQNGINQGTDKNFVLPSFTYGYADNYPNDAAEAGIDIDWAVDKNGKPANLPGVDFIKIYTGVNQENGWLGENSTDREWTSLKSIPE